MKKILEIRDAIAKVLMFCIGFYVLYTAFFGGPTVYTHRTIFLSAILAITFLTIPLPEGKAARTILFIFYGILAIASIAYGVYGTYNSTDILIRAGTPTRWDYFFCVLLFVLVFIATYKKAGITVAIICGVFVIYLLFGHLLTGSLRHARIGFKLITSEFFNSTGGMLGSCMGIASTYILIFIIFGAFLSESGAGDFFNDLANHLTRNSYGGPAKAAVIASMLLGMISGSTTANVVTTGAVTIPLMKRNGYPKEFAGAVETTASMGGQIMPPVMGSSVFLMSEFVGIPYGKICFYAMVPAILYYFSIYLSVHFKARVLDLAKNQYQDDKTMKQILLSGIHYLLAIGTLIGTLLYGWTPQKCGISSICVLLVASLFQKKSRIGLKSVFRAITSGVRSSLTLSVTCAASGIIIGVISTSSLSIKLSSFVLNVSNGNVVIALVMTATASIILGMGVLSAAAYIILASLLGPVLSKLGIDPLAGHLFIYYFGLLANITPPVALSALAAANLAEGDFVKTCAWSMRLGIAAYLIPCVFVMDQHILLRYPFVECIIPILTAFVGVFILNVGCSGWMLTKVKWPFRVACVVAGLCFIYTGTVTDVIGVAISAVCVVQQFIQRRHELRLSPT